MHTNAVQNIAEILAKRFRGRRKFEMVCLHRVCHAAARQKDAAKEHSDAVCRQVAHIDAAFLMDMEAAADHRDIRFACDAVNVQSLSAFPGLGLDL